MQYVNANDGGRTKSAPSGAAYHLSPIVYNEEIAALAAQQKRKYREVYLEVVAAVEADNK